VRIVLLAYLIALPLYAVAQERPQPTHAAVTDHGKYIVEHIAMCGECHTPRDMSGNLQNAAYLKGGPVPVSPPPFANISWALQAPPIAGLAAYSDQQGIRLLMEGITADGRQLRPPMPRFRMNRRDAEAVVAFLKSLK
jgi:mono/diheme cytochrome c family protein